MLPRPVRAVVFDMDGLLVDSEAVFRDSMMHVAQERGHDLPLEVFLRMVGLPGPSSRSRRRLRPPGPRARGRPTSW